MTQDRNVSCQLKRKKKLLAHFCKGRIENAYLACLCRSIAFFMCPPSSIWTPICPVKQLETMPPLRHVWPHPHSCSHCGWVFPTKSGVCHHIAVTIYFSFLLSYVHSALPWPCLFKQHLVTLSPCPLITTTPRYFDVLLPYLSMTLTLLTSPCPYPVLILVLVTSSSSSQPRPHLIFILDLISPMSHLLSPYTPEYSLSWTLYSSLSGLCSLDLYLDPQVSPVLFLSSPSSL